MRNKNCTSFEIEIPVRDRMREVAKAMGITMKEWLLKKVEEDEVKMV
jgi:hypothetical protein